MRKIYMDNGSTSFPKAPDLGKVMGEHIDQTGINIGRGSYASSFELERMAVLTKEKLGGFFHAPHSRNVVFTSGATMGLNMILNGLLEPGDRVVTTSLEHNAVARPLYALASQGVIWDLIKTDADGFMPHEEMERALTQQTKLLVVTHASNVTGALISLSPLSRICRERGILLVLDAAQTAGSRVIHMDELSLDGLVVPGHKGLLGPQGIGVMILSDELATKIRPTILGGTGSRSDMLEMPDYLPDRFEPGTLNVPGIVGLNHALDYLLSEGVDEIRAHKETLSRRFLEGLMEIQGVTLHGPGLNTPREAVFSVVFKNKDQGESAFLLERDFGILTRSGLHCAPLAHQSSGSFPGGSVRFSFGRFTTISDVDDALSAILAITKA